MKKLVVLGITGSIGDSTLKVLRKYNTEFQLVGFSYNSNFEKAKAVFEEFSCKYVCCTSDIKSDHIDFWKSQGVELLPNMRELALLDYDQILTAVVGATGVPPTYEAAKSGRTILLANKETLVMAGEFILDVVKKNSAKIIPVDSEHSSVFRLIKGKLDIKKVILTASGGPLRKFSLDEIKAVSKARVLDHPTWSMGDKITTDSAGMINKALEVIEAKILFELKQDEIDAVIHPQSYVHAITMHTDGTYSFHVSKPDMVYPIAYAMFYPNTPPMLLELEQTNQIPSLEFYEIEKEKFPGFFLGLEASKAGGFATATFNAANEAAVELFLKDQIHFTQIPGKIARALENSPFTSSPEGLDHLLEADNWARNFVKN